jgi:ABC-type nitrate/sulfonate/bicarbonate transport system substrate-binding protein
MESSDIMRPADLDGKIYGGWGAVGEQEYIEALIQADGGQGDFTFVGLAASTHEALISEQVDFVIGFDNYEVIDSELRGTPIRQFHYADYGIPPTYAGLITCNNDWLDENPDVARRFVEATARAWKWAHENPDEAVAILIEENPGMFPDDHSVEWMKQGQHWQTDNEWNLDEDGNVGCQRPEIFIDGSQWLFDAGVYTDADGNPLTEAPDATAFFTNEYLPDYCTG